MADRRNHLGNHANYIFSGPANLRELENTNLSGAHLHFNGPFDLRDLVAVDLRNTTLNINDYRGLPPCSDCGKALGDGQAQPLDSSTILPPTPSSHLSTDETNVPQSPPRKKSRKRQLSEDGELDPSSPASRSTVKPFVSELHPDRVAMLRDPSPEVEARPVQPILRTKANCLEMPFNRLEQRQVQRALTHFSTGTSTSLVPQDKMLPTRTVTHRSDSVDEAGKVAVSGEHVSNNSSGKAHFNGEESEERVDDFLRTLEPVVPVLAQQSEQFGRLSPVPYIDSEMPETLAPSTSPGPLKLEG